MERMGTDRTDEFAYLGFDIHVVEATVFYCGK